MASQDLVISSSESDSDFEEPPAKRSRGKAGVYSKVQSFDTSDQALQHVQSQKMWYLRKRYSIDEGEKVLYDCKYSRNCAAKIYILFKSENQSAHLYSTSEGHTHPARPEVGIPTDVKNKIEQLFRDGVTQPKTIMSRIRESGLKEPTARQLGNFMAKLRRKINGEPILSLGQLAKAMEEDSVQPESLDSAFVCKYEIEFEGEKFFRFAYTTQRLQGLAVSGRNLHTDATYKLLWNGFPVLIVGFTDKNRKFFPTCLATCSSETTADFAFIFESIKAKTNFTPGTIIADCADAITNAAELAFGTDVVRMYCWAHVIAKIDKRIDAIHDKEIRPKLRADILALQLARSDDEFNTASQLWLKKWSQVAAAENFVQYFKAEYLENYRGWHVGHSLGAPCTNNALEATNNVIKSHYTLRNRLPLHMFRNVVKKMVHDWSVKLCPTETNYIPFAETPTYTLALETEAYNWKKAGPGVKTRTHGSTKVYFIPTSANPVLKEPDLNKYVKQFKLKNWKKFDTYVSSCKSLWLVTIDDGDWRNGTCTCPPFLKTYVCKHILGIALVEKYFEVRPEAKNVPIGEKRKRGRPSKAKKALLVQ